MKDRASLRTLNLHCSPLHLDASLFRKLLQKAGPSLGLWRAAEVAGLREQAYVHPVLDLGCGDGLVTSMVLDRVELGIDPDTHVLRVAAQTGIYEQLTAVRAENALVPEGTVATVLCNSVLEHIENLTGMLAAVARMLMPGGSLIFTAPSAEFATWLALPFRRYAAWRNRHLIHVNLLSARQWMKVLSRVGLGVVAIRPYLRRTLVFTWDVLDLLEQIWVARRRLVGLVWRRLPSAILNWLAHAASRMDLSAPYPGGGQVITARKQC